MAGISEDGIFPSDTDAHPVSQWPIEKSPRGGQPSRRRRGFLVATLLATVACSSSPAERRSEIYDLKADPTDANVQLIRERLADQDRDVRATALNAALGLEVPDSAELALTALDDPDGFVRSTAAKLLGDLGQGRYAEPLAGCLLEDPDPIARQRAAESLQRLGGPVAVRALAEALDDPMERVRRAAIAGLADVGPGYAKESVSRLLREDAVWEIRVQAANVLGRTGDPEMLPVLEAALEDPNEFVRSAVANAIRTLEQ